MLDTSFLIRLMKEDDPLHKSALDYFSICWKKSMCYLFQQ